MMQASLIIPTYNEAKNLPLLLQEIEQSIDRSWLDLEYIIVDDNSPDGTGQVADELSKQYPVRVLHRAGKQGLGSAVRAGFAASQRPYLAVMDADLSHDPAILGTLFKDLKTNQIAIGSRFAEGSSVENWQLGRKLLSQTGVALARRLTGVQDPLSGYFVFCRSVIEGVDLNTVGYKILLEILVKGKYQSVCERAFLFRMRRHSSSKLNVAEYWFFAKQLITYATSKFVKKQITAWPVTVVWLLLIGATLGVAGTQSVWLDEGLAWSFSQHSPAWLVNLARTSDLHPPTYYLFLHAVGVTFGFGVVLLRALSVLWYGLFVRVLYKRLIAPMTENNWIKAALLAAMAFSPFGIFYASELRSYALIMFVSALQIFAFNEVGASEVTKRWALIKYALYSFILVWVFYPGAFLLTAQFLYVSVRKRLVWKRFFWPWAAVAVAYSPWLFSVVLARAGVQPDHFLTVSWWQIPAIIAAGFSGGRVAVTDLNHLHHYWPTALALLGFLLGLSGLWYWWRHDRQNKFVESVWWQLLIPVFICLVISATRFSVFDPRYYVEVYPLYVILLVSALQYQLRYARAKATWLIAVVLGLSLVVNSLYWFNPWYAREPWKTVVPQLESQLEVGDAVMFIGNFQPPPTYAIYQTKTVPVIGIYPDDLTSLNDTQRIADHVRQSVVGIKRIWYSQFLEWQKDAGGQWRTVIEQEGFKYVRTIGFFKVKFDLYERQ